MEINLKIKGSDEGLVTSPERFEQDVAQLRSRYKPIIDKAKRVEAHFKARREGGKYQIGGNVGLRDILDQIDIGEAPTNEQLVELGQDITPIWGDLRALHRAYKMMGQPIDPTQFVRNGEFDQGAYIEAHQNKGGELGLELASGFPIAGLAAYGARTIGKNIGNMPNYFRQSGGAKLDDGPSMSLPMDDPNQKYFWLDGVEVVKNPSTSDYKRMNKEIRKNFPDAGDKYFGETIRHTIDADGNRYIWPAHDAVHEQIEPMLSNRLGRSVSQNYNEKVSDVVQKQIDANKREALGESIGLPMDEASRMERAREIAELRAQANAQRFGSDPDALQMDEASRVQRARDMGFDVDNPLYHGSSSSGVPVEFSDLRVGGVPIFRRGKPVDYSPYQFTNNPTPRDHARALFQEQMLINEWDLKDELYKGGEKGLYRKAEGVLTDFIDSYQDDWPEIVPELENMLKRVKAHANSVNYTGGPSPQGIEAFSENAFNPGLYGKGIYMTDSPIIAGGGQGNDIAEFGYATSGDLTKVVARENELRGEISELQKTLSKPDVENREILEEWVNKNKEELDLLGQQNTGNPTVYPLVNRVENPWLPEKMKLRRKDLPKDKLDQLNSYFDSTGKTRSGRWPMSDESLRYYMGDDWLNQLLEELGYDGIKHTGGRVTGAPKHDVTIAFKPNQVRSVNAAFDPAKKDSADLLANRLLPIPAGMLGIGVLDDEDKK